MRQVCPVTLHESEQMCRFVHHLDISGGCGCLETSGLLEVIKVHPLFEVTRVQPGFTFLAFGRKVGIYLDAWTLVIRYMYLRFKREGRGLKKGLKKQNRKNNQRLDHHG